MRTFVLILVLLLSETVALAGDACTPPCRSGYLCHQGQCVSACNPVCAANQVCTPAGECLSRCNPVCEVGHACTPAGECVAPVPQSKPGASVLVPPPGGFPTRSGLSPGATNFRAPMQAHMERKDRGMYIGGIVSLSLGGIAVAAGTAVVILNTDSEEYCVPGTGNCWDVDDDEGVAAGAGVLGLGVALLIAGSVLTVIGGERVPLSSIVDGGSKPPQLSITPTFGGVHATLDF